VWLSEVREFVETSREMRREDKGALGYAAMVLIALALPRLLIATVLVFLPGWLFG